MSEHRVEDEAVESVLAELASITSGLEEALMDADRLSARMHGSWSGMAADAHEGAHGRWSQDVTEMNTALARLRGLLQDAQGN